MKSVRKKSASVLKFHSLSNYDFVEHCFTSRVGGYSTESYSSLNMGFSTGDDRDTVVKNYAMVADEIFNASIEDMVLSNQVHKTEIAVVGEGDRGRGFSESFKYSEIDGLLTDKKGIMLATIYADCTPLFFLDREKRVVGVAHAGWRGTVEKIGKKMVEKMKLEYGSNPTDIVVAIGPSIGPCCYQVGEEVYERFKSSFKDLSMIDVEDGVIKLDLWQANRVAIMEAGVLEGNIEIGKHCTNCKEELFYSHRRDDGVTGRMAGIIKLK